MEKDSKKIIILIFVFLIILLLSISIIIYNNTASKVNIGIDKEKIYYMTEYLDREISYMLSQLNNINMEETFYINWDKLKKQTIILYNFWNSVILDFNNLDIEKKDLSEFGKSLDRLMISINNNSAEESRKELLDLYNKLVIYSKSIDIRGYNEILEAKLNLLIALTVIEKENWTLAHEYILKSSKSITKVVNSTQKNQYNFYQAYISIKELENIINIKDIEVFYFKYNNAMKNLDKIKKIQI